MNQELMEIVLPRLAERLHRHLQRFQAGKLDQAGFTRKFEALLQRQFTWLADRGVPPVDAAVAIHAAVLILSTPGLRAEAEEQDLPLEVIEYQALKLAARDISERYGKDEGRTIDRLAALVAHYAE